MARACVSGYKQREQQQRPVLHVLAPYSAHVIAPFSTVVALW
jgi:hypothetical protein